MVKLFLTLLTILPLTCRKVPLPPGCETYPANKSIGMQVSEWDFYSEKSHELLPPAQGRYEQGNDELRFYGITYRLGSRLSTKEKYCIANKVIYVKWKVGKSNGFSDYHCSFYYDKMALASDDEKRVDFSYGSVHNTWDGSVLIEPDTWYYTRISIENGNAISTTATNGYSKQGGHEIQTMVRTLPSTYGYLAIRQGDTYGGNQSSITVGEYRISDR